MKKLLILLTVTYLLFFVSIQAETKRNLSNTINTYFLATKIKNKKSVCISSGVGKKIIIGTSPKKLNATNVSYLKETPLSIGKSVYNSAKKECLKRISSPKCSDRCDNDADGLRDYPLDPECTSKEDQTEQFIITDCSDGLDNDGDGKSDFPADSGCQSINDTTEEDNIADSSPYALFRKPYDGEYAVGSMFDHYYPRQFIDNNGVIVNFEGENLTLGIDGHQGYDLALGEGTPLLSVYDGTVVFAGTESPFFCPPLNKTVSGNAVTVKHVINNEEFLSIFAHLSSLSVTTGQKVSKGQLIGLSGNTGCSTSAHLHFNVQKITNTKMGKPVDVDSFGWRSLSPDPWEISDSGAKSVNLWAHNEGPKIFKNAKFNLLNNTAPILITEVMWAGNRDDINPNNEFIEITVDGRYISGASNYSLNGFVLKNNNNDTFAFPADFTLNANQSVKVYTGQGENTSQNLYWGKNSGIWNNNGDCVRLIHSGINYIYYIGYGASNCPAPAVSNDKIPTIFANKIETILDANNINSTLSLKNILGLK